MDSNPYLAPLSEPAVEIASERSQRYYVVSRAKFYALFIGTLGMYELYWVYKHWAQFKRATKGSEWPVMRALFPVFFIHSLTAEIDHTIRRNELSHKWGPGTLATVIIIVLITSGILDRLSMKSIGSPTTDILSLLFLPLIAYLFYRVQLAANIACDDPTGKTNSSFTAANFVWLGLGFVLWILSLAGLYALLNPDAFDFLLNL